jgi:hypothetical protein
VKELTDREKEIQKVKETIRARSSYRLTPQALKELNDRRLRLAAILYSNTTEMAIGAILLTNFIMILVDTDLNAAGDDSPAWLNALNWVCLGAYTTELSIRLYVERTRIFLSGWNILDMVVVFSGIVCSVIEASEIDVVSISVLRMFRCFRLLRLMKFRVLVHQLKELRKLIRGITSCLRTLFWSMILVFVFMTLWSTLAVELLHPVMRGMEVSVWEDCPRCSRAFSSIMDSNLTFFKTIMTGDSWGLVAVPVVEKHPWSALVFVGSHFTIVVGLLNLIIAVLVDTAAEARSRDTAARAKEAADMEVTEKRQLEGIFRQIDFDESGALSFDELSKGAESVPEMSQKLRVMDIQGGDLAQLFQMLDEDGSGEVDPEEFIETLYRMKCGDDKTASTFVKHYVVHMKQEQLKMASMLTDIRHELHTIKNHLPGHRKQRQGVFGNGNQQEEVNEGSTWRSSFARNESQTTEATEATEATEDEALPMSVRTSTLELNELEAPPIPSSCLPSGLKAFQKDLAHISFSVGDLDHLANVKDPFSTEFIRSPRPASTMPITRPNTHSPGTLEHDRAILHKEMRIVEEKLMQEQFLNLEKDLFSELHKIIESELMASTSILTEASVEDNVCGPSPRLHSALSTIRGNLDQSIGESLSRALKPLQHMSNGYKQLPQAWLGRQRSKSSTNNESPGPAGMTSSKTPNQQSASESSRPVALKLLMMGN